MRYKQRRKAQRLLNKKIRTLNNSICKDNLWQGRFEVRQNEADWCAFQDGSGGELFVSLRFYDKHTGYYRDYVFDMLYPNYNVFFDQKLFMVMNEFIINDCDVWSENPSPRDAKNFVIDYTKQHIPDSVMQKDYNYYLSKEAF